MSTKKIILLLLLTCIGGFLFFFACKQTYESKITELKAKSLNALAEALNSELFSRDLHGNISLNFTYKSMYPDSLETVYWEDAFGRHEYVIDSEKKMLNIEKDPNVRVMHSIAFFKEPLQPDSLNAKWLEQLKLSNINFETAIQISVFNEDGDIKSQKLTLQSEWYDSSNPIFYRYIGYASEVKVDCFLHFSMWEMIYKEMLIFLLLYIIGVLGLYKFFVFIECKLNSLRSKEVLEVHIYEEVQKISATPIRSYKLGDGIIFSADRNVIIINGIEKKIQAQSSLLLELFFKSNQDYIIKDGEIIENLWPDGSGNDARMHKAVYRLRTLINKIDPTFDIIKKVGTYQLIISENSSVN